MNVELAIAALGCLVLAFGHTTIGLRWVLPNLTKGSLPSTPFGSPSMTLGMVRFTWHVVSVLLLRWFAVLWLAATALACWNARRRPRSLLRLPVPLVFVVIAVLCWTAST